MAKNNFDILRISLAIIVFYYHTGILTGNEFFSFFPGYFAVHCFFVVSGFLIVKSFLKRNNLIIYIKARFFRIYPLYFIVILLSFGLGYLNYSQTFVDYLYDGAFNYLLYNSIFINFLQPRLPELFDNNIFTAVNGALWTIKIEVMFYMSVPLIYGALAKYVNTTILTIFFGLSSVLIYYCLPYIIDTYSLHPSLNNQLPSLMIFFMIGAMFNFLKLDFLKAGHIFIVLPMIYFLKDFYLPYSLTVGLFVYIFALKVKPINISKKIGDISYGVYIFHFPIIQALAMYGFFENFYLGLLIASVLVFGCSLISWHYIESKLIHKPKN